MRTQHCNNAKDVINAECIVAQCRKFMQNVLYRTKNIGQKNSERTRQNIIETCTPAVDKRNATSNLQNGKELQLEFFTL